MSIDHNYARGKLKLLLRDLSNYNAGEFWREMSRIASGATASIHAEGLKAERDALADSNTQLSQQNEAQIRMNAKLMHERDALAAHVERFRSVALDALCNMAAGRMREEMKSCYEDTPETSLARRDALTRADAFAEAAAICRKVKEGQDGLAWMHKEVSPDGEEYIGDYGIPYSNKAFGAQHCADDLQREVKRFRRQAEGQQ